MKPRHIAYIVWAVIALLGVICWLVPEDGFAIGKWTLRWPTLAEALDLSATEDVDILPLDSII